LALVVTFSCAGSLACGSASDDAPASDGGDDAVDASDVGVGPDGTDGAIWYPLPCVIAGTVGECIDVSLCTGGRVATPGYCPGPKNIQCCTNGNPLADAATDLGDTGGWCPTDPAARPNEGLVEEPGVAGCPKGMIPIYGSTGTFCIDRFEASIVLVEPSTGKESSWTPFYPPPSGKTYRAVSLRNAVPQGYISGNQATTACAASKKRLCTNDEWLRACRGPSGFVYPYGNTRMDGTCNDARTPHPAVSCFKTTASWIFSEITYPGINQQPSTVDKTGSRSGCVTAEGAFDMMGNLHEWIYDDPSAYTDPIKAIDFRGGFYADTKLNGEGCLYRTTAHNMMHWDYSTGFRCCADRP